MSKRRPKVRAVSNQIRDKRLSEKAVIAPEDTGSTDHMPPVLSFKDVCPNHFQLEEWQGTELKQLVDTLKKLGNSTWQDALKIKGLGIKIVDPKTFSKDLPEYISPDVSIYECRVSQRARLFGYRIRNVFHVIWFDRNHEVYPMS